MAPEQRLEAAMRLSRAVRTMTMADLRESFPHADGHKLKAPVVAQDVLIYSTAGSFCGQAPRKKLLNASAEVPQSCTGDKHPYTHHSRALAGLHPVESRLRNRRGENVDETGREPTPSLKEKFANEHVGGIMAPMTWVVGTSSPLGFGFVAADIRVTMPGKRTLECLQKVHRLSSNIICGFSGSVDIGLKAVAFLQAELTKRPPAGSKHDLTHMALTWLPRALRRFLESQESVYRQLGCSLVLAGLSPHLSMGDWPLPRPRVILVSSPRFIPRLAKTGETVSAGSGDDVSMYREAIGGLGLEFPFIQTGIEGAEGQARMLMFELFNIVKKSPVPGVSALFTVGLVDRQEATVIELDLKEHKDGSSRRIHTPPLAYTLDTFHLFARRAGFSASEAAAATA
jgi:hypothetical protein